MCSDDKHNHYYENENMDVIEISSVNRIRFNTHVLILMLAITNTSKLPQDRNYIGPEVVKTDKWWQKQDLVQQGSLIKDEMKELDYQTWFDEEQMLDDTDVQMSQGIEQKGLNLFLLQSGTSKR